MKIVAVEGWGPHHAVGGAGCCSLAAVGVLCACCKHAHAQDACCWGGDAFALCAATRISQAKHSCKNCCVFAPARGAWECLPR